MIKDYCGFWFEWDERKGKEMNNHCLKYVFLLLLYSSYVIIAVVLVIALVNAGEGKDAILDYVTKTGNKIFLIILFVLGVSIYIVYSIFKKNKAFKAVHRKYLNLLIDILRNAFHVLYLIYIRPFCYNNNDIIPGLIVSFWLTVTASCLFFVRGIVFWAYYLCSQGKNKHMIWEPI